MVRRSRLGRRASVFKEERAEMRKIPVRGIIAGIVVAAILGLGYWGVKALSAGDQKGQLVMATKPVTKGNLEVTVRGWGMLQATEERDVMTGAEGVIEEIFFEPGQAVKKGQVLATIDPGSLEVKIKQNEIKIDVARVELARAFGVSPDKVTEVDPSTALVIRSPISGTVRELSAQAGSSASGKICRVVDDGRLLIKFEVPKPLFDKIAVGQRTTFMPSRFDGKDPGTVIKCDSTPIAGREAYYYEVWVEMVNPGLLKVDDEGILLIHTPSGDVQQKVTITSYGFEETVVAPFGGKVKSVFVKEGVKVKEGDPILEFEPGEALLSAMAKQLEFKQQLIELEDLKSQLKSLTIVAPIDGVAMYRNVNPGQAVGKGINVTRISNFTKMNLMLRIDEIDVPKLAEGQEAKVFAWGPEGRQEVRGVVSRIGVGGQTGDGFSSFNITVAVDNPGFLRPGMGAEAQIFVGSKQNILLCPVEALYKENEKWFVDVKEGKERKPVEVQVGLMNDQFAEVISGLSEGQEVVVGMTKEEPKPGGTVTPPIKMIR